MGFILHKTHRMTVWQYFVKFDVIAPLTSPEWLCCSLKMHSEHTSCWGINCGPLSLRMKDPNSVVTYTFTFLCLEHEKLETHPRYHAWMNGKSLCSRSVTETWEEFWNPGGDEDKFTWSGRPGSNLLSVGPTFVRSPFVNSTDFHQKGRREIIKLY